MGVQVGARAAGEKKPGGEKIAMVRLWSFFGVPNARAICRGSRLRYAQEYADPKVRHPANEESKRGEKRPPHQDCSLDISLQLDSSDVGAIDIIAKSRHDLSGLHGV